MRMTWLHNDWSLSSLSTDIYSISNVIYGPTISAKGTVYSKPTLKGQNMVTHNDFLIMCKVGT